MRYAYEYRCPQVFVFDTRTLVIVQFRASRPEDIRDEACQIDCCVVPREFDSQVPRQCTMQYALYRLAWRGWVRLCATLGSQRDGRSGEVVRVRKSLSLAGWTRKYEYWSGRPVWIDSRGNRHTDHPQRFRRDFVWKARQRGDGALEMDGFWVWTDGTREIFDTLNCFIS